MTIDKLAKIIKKGFDDVDKRFDKVDKRFLEQDQKFVDLESLLTEKSASIWLEIKSLRQEIKRLEEKIDKISNTEAEDIKPVYFDVENLKKEILTVKNRLKLLETRQLKTA